MVGRLQTSAVNAAPTGYDVFSIGENERQEIAFGRLPWAIAKAIGPGRIVRLAELAFAACLGRTFYVLTLPRARRIKKPARTCITADLAGLAGFE